MLKEYDKAFEIAKVMEDSETWKSLAAITIKAGRFDLTRECLYNAHDYATLLFFSYCIKDAGTIKKIATISKRDKLYNIAFLANYILGKFNF